MSYIGAFPLSMVCFPGEIQHLHIFEPRYRELVEDFRLSNSGFALIPFMNGKSFHLGTEVIIDAIERTYPDGKYDIAIRGTQVLKIHRLQKKLTGKSYPGAKVSLHEWIMNPSYEKSVTLNTLVTELYQLLNIDNAKVPSPQKFEISKVVHKIGLSIEQELQLLAIKTESDRQSFVIDHLIKFIPEVKKMKDLQLKAALNGHFKNLDPSNF